MKHTRLVVALLTFLGLLSAGCATDRQVVQQAEDTHSQLEPTVVEDAELRAYLETMGQRIVDSAKTLSAEGYGPKSHFEEDNSWMFTDVRFQFVNSDQLNAFTTGGDHMYIYTELLRTCRSEDELAAVMAHEYGHVYARHVHKGMNRQYWSIGGSLLGGAAGYALAGDDHKMEGAAIGLIGTSSALTFLNMGYTRGDEAEADELGFDFYVRAGWDPAKFGDFFQQMVDKGLDTTPEMMSDHPSLKSRVEYAKKRASSLPPEAKSWRRPAVAEGAKFASMQQRATLLAQKMPKDKTMEAAQTLLAAVPSCLLPEDQPKQKAAQQKLAERAQVAGPPKP